MKWILFACITVLVALVALCAAFTLRESYKLTLVRTESAADRVRALAKKHIDVYEKTYALVFFFGGDLSSSIDKKEFTLSDEMPMQNIFDTARNIDLELSDLVRKIEDCESIMKDRGASVKKTLAEIEILERDFIAETVAFNKYVSRARITMSVRPLRRLLKNIGKCPYRTVNV